MSTIVVSMSIILAVVVVIAALVVVGMEGRLRTRAPRLSDTMARAARHLNGDGQPPRALERLRS